MTPSSRFIGRPHDFDFLVGGRWTIHNRRLRARHVGSDDWYEFTGTCRGQAMLDGIVSIDENHFPSEGSSGCSVRTLDLAAKRWSIYWISSKSGVLFPPVHGGWDDDRGEFYGTDDDDGRFVFARFLWFKQGPDQARWEQAFSLDGNGWETNWTMDLRREG